MKRIKSEELNRISTTNTDGLLRVFYRLVDDIKFELDNKFKNYNRLIKDSKKKIDIQVKATKKAQRNLKELNSY